MGVWSLLPSVHGSSMKISALIERLTKLQAVAKDDVEVAVHVGHGHYEEAIAELQWVIPKTKNTWRQLEIGNTDQIVVIL